MTELKCEYECIKCLGCPECGASNWTYSTDCVSCMVCRLRAQHNAERSW